ncbi:MAG TPA: YbaB/EbfC family nucleoid-associated protein [Gemmataceae bacterium]|nr:YbaB/EbfC family nucleoid-associated protein [Gemmataceae bacterium]
MSWLGNLGSFAKIMGQLPRLKEEAERMQQRLDQIVVEGNAGAGMVKMLMNGRMVVLRCDIAPEALALNDREILEDLIVSATNQALEKARQALGEETSKFMGGMGLPPGLNLPGLG